MKTILLLVESLRVERGGRIVLSDLSFSLAAGQVLLVSGRNGAGKSTLLRTLAGLLPQERGRVTVAGTNEDLRGPELMHYVGYEDALKPMLTVRENLAFWAAMLSTPASFRPPGEELAPASVSNHEGSPATSPFETPAMPAPQGEDGGWDKVLAYSPDEALAAFGIARLIDLPAAYLSAGQKRRVALARLLLAPRPLWLLDEPMIALDTGAQAILAEVMGRHTASGGAIVAASHTPLGLPCATLELGATA